MEISDPAPELLIVGETPSGLRWFSPPLPRVDTDLGTIPLADACPTRGLVRDAWGGPIAEAVVLARTKTEISVPVGTDFEGRFEIGSLGTPAVELEVSKPGYRTARVGVPEEGGPIVIRMEAGAAVLGKVVGIPPPPLRLADLTIRARWDGGEDTVEVGAEGHFRVSGLPLWEEVHLEVLPDPMHAARIAGRVLAPQRTAIPEGSPVTIPLFATSPLIARLSDARTSLPIADDTPVRITMVTRTGTCGLPEARGAHLRIDGVPIGEAYQLVVQAQGYRERRLPLPSATEAETLDLGVLALRPLESIQLRVLSSRDGAPVEGAVLICDGARTRTDSDGLGRISVPGTNTLVRVFHPSFLPASLRSGRPGVEATVRLRRSASIAVRVLEGGEVPVPGARVLVRPQDQDALPLPAFVDSSIARVGREQTDRDGRALRLGLAPGSWRVYVWVPLFEGAALASAHPSKTFLVGLTEGQDIDSVVHLPRREPLLVRVTEDGVPLAGAALEVLPGDPDSGTGFCGGSQLASPMGTLLGKTDLAGELNLTAVLQGPALLRLTPPEGSPRLFHVQFSGSAPLLLEDSTP